MTETTYTERINLRLDPETKAALERLAREQREPQSAVLRRLIREAAERRAKR